MFASLNGKVSNLTISNANITVTGGRVGILANEGNGTIERVLVTGSVISGALECGGLIGRAGDASSITLKGCSVSDCEIARSDNQTSPYSSAGGLVGFFSEPFEFSEQHQVTGCTWASLNLTKAKYTGPAAGILFNAQHITLSGNTDDDNAFGIDYHSTMLGEGPVALRHSGI